MSKGFDDYMYIRTRRCFDSETKVHLLDDDIVQQVVKARNENYRKIVEQMKKYLEENGEEVGE